MQCLALLICLILALPAAAQDRYDAERHLREIAWQVDDRLLKNWRIMPEITRDDVANLGHGYGRQGALGAADIETAIAHAHAHAQARARALRDVLSADLDGDLAVTRAQVELVDLSLCGAGRGRLWTRFRHADGDVDGMLSLVEMTASAQEAEYALSLIAAIDPVYLVAAQPDL